MAYLFCINFSLSFLSLSAALTLRQTKNQQFPISHVTTQRSLLASIFLNFEKIATSQQKDRLQLCAFPIL